MTSEVPVLDHGFVRVVTHWGSDEEIIESARMSTQKGFQGWGGPGSGLHTRDCRNEDCPGCAPGDEKLLRYLWEHKHSTPFEFAGATFEVQAPIFVFREWHRHRTASYSEMSARYAPLPDVNYVPSVERIMTAADGNKQAGAVKGSEPLTEYAVQTFRGQLLSAYRGQQKLYDEALKAGIPKEVARVVLPFGRYSKMRASTDLRNWLGFLILRMDKNAQWEIQQYAKAVHGELVKLFPRTLALFDDVGHEFA